MLLKHWNKVAVVVAETEERGEAFPFVRLGLFPDFVEFGLVGVNVIF